MMTETLSIADYDVEQLRVGLHETCHLLDELAQILNPNHDEDLIECARNTVAEMKSAWREITRLQEELRRCKETEE